MVSRLLLAVALTGLGACGSPSSPPPGAGPGPGHQAEVCNNQSDDDGDAKVDCLDPDCFGAPSCLRQIERCDNHLDDDGNGLTDCADPRCDGQSCGPECRCEHGAPADRGDGGSASGGGGSAAGGGGSAAGGGGSAAGGGGSAAGGGGSAAGGGGSAAGGGSASGGGGSCTGCGVGCDCAGGVGVEVECGDLDDNDGDGSPDCADPDCVGRGTEVCDDGIDNTCDRAIDCGDPACLASKACAVLVDGSPCLRDTQCAGEKCLTEEVDGAPNGSCTNAADCSPSTNAGCHGGRCTLTDSTASIYRCLAPCTGDGLGDTGRCRAGYACTDVDTTPSNDNNVCVPSCTCDAECAGQGAGYGCNLWSKTCAIKDRGLLRYGAACNADSQCETGICHTDRSLPNGYCLGPCRGDRLECAAGGVCDHQTAPLDNIGTCYQGCQGSTECRAAELYTCEQLASGEKACLVW